MTNRHRAESLAAQGVSGFYPSKTPLRPAVSALKRLRSVPLQTTSFMSYCGSDSKRHDKCRNDALLTVSLQLFSHLPSVAFPLCAYKYLQSQQEKRQGSGASLQWVPPLRYTQGQAPQDQGGERRAGWKASRQASRKRSRPTA